MKARSLFSSNLGTDDVVVCADSLPPRDHPTGNAQPGIAGGLRPVIVRAQVDDDAPPDDVSDAEPIGEKRHLRLAGV